MYLYMFCKIHPAVTRRRLCTLQHPGQRRVPFNALNKSQMDHSALVSVLITLTFRDLLKAHQRYYSNITSHVVLFPPNEGISISSDGWCAVSQGWWQSLFLSPRLPQLAPAQRYPLVSVFLSNSFLIGVCQHNSEPKIKRKTDVHMW